MKPGPAFQLYPQDFLVGCAELTAEQVGGYIRLLCYQWSKGALPDNNKLLAALAGCRLASIAVLRTKFKKGEDGLLRNERLEAVRAEQENYRQKQADRAANGWSRRKAAAQPAHEGRHSQRNAGDASLRHMPEGCPSSSPSPSNNINLAPAAAAAGEKPKKTRPRNVLLDALATCDGSRVDEITDSAWGATAKALSEIQRVTPDVTPMEIHRRARNYREHMRDAVIGPNALAKHWAKCAVGTTPQPKPRVETPEPRDWKSFLNHEFPDSRFSEGQPNEAHKWTDLDEQTQRWLVGEMKKRDAA